MVLLTICVLSECDPEALYDGLRRALGVSPV